MNKTTTPSTETVAEKGGRTESTLHATANNSIHQSAVALVMFILIDHDFVNEIHSGTPARLNQLYLHFTREVVALYHSSEKRDEIYSALVLAEEHLTVILEGLDAVCVVSINLIGRALKFLQRYLTKPVEESADTALAKEEDAEKMDDVKDELIVYTVPDMPNFKWQGKFTEAVQYIEAIIDMEYIKDTDKNASSFIRFMLDILGFNEKTLKHYQACRHKQCMKNIKTEKGQRRCAFLYKLYTNSEKEWNLRNDRIQ